MPFEQQSLFDVGPGPPVLADEAVPICNPGRSPGVPKLSVGGLGPVQEWGVKTSPHPPQP